MAEWTSCTLHTSTHLPNQNSTQLTPTLHVCLDTQGMHSLGRQVTGKRVFFNDLKEPRKRQPHITCLHVKGQEVQLGKEQCGDERTHEESVHLCSNSGDREEERTCRLLHV